MKHYERGIAYVGYNLHLPKEHIHERSIRAALTLEGPSAPDSRFVTEIEAFLDLGSHLRVPRHFWTTAEISASMELQDDRKTEFAQCGWESWIKPRDESQAAAMDAASTSAANGEGGLVVLGCGKGKTVVAIETIARVGEPALIVVPTTEILRQWCEEIERFLGVVPSVVQGPKKNFGDLTVAMLHTLSTREWPSEVLDHYGLVFFDECHRLAAPSFNTVAPQFVGKRFGLTATREREDGLEALYQFHLGGVLYADLSTDMVPEVYFVKTGVRMHHTQGTEIRSKVGTVNVSMLRNFLALNHYRNWVILKEIAFARAKGRRILVLGHCVDHLVYLHQSCPGSGLCIGKVKGKERKRALEEDEVVFATTKLAAEGLNAPWLDTLVIVTPLSSTNLFQQAVGRVLRQHPGKKDPRVIVIEDRIRAVTKMLGSLKRYCKQSGLPFSVIEVGYANEYPGDPLNAWQEELEEALFLEQ